MGKKEGGKGGQFRLLAPITSLLPNQTKAFPRLWDYGIQGALLYYIIIHNISNLVNLDHNLIT